MSDWTFGSGRKSHLGRRIPLMVAILSCGAFVASSPAQATETVFKLDRAPIELLSLSSDEEQGNGASGSGSRCGIGSIDGTQDTPSISDNGRFIAFSSVASNLVAGDNNGYTDVFVRDRKKGTTQLVSVTERGLVPSVPVGFQIPGCTNWSYDPSISGDGRHVAFASYGQLVPGAPIPELPLTLRIYVRDLKRGTTEHISIATDGTPANGSSGGPIGISDDGKRVAFESFATNLAEEEITCATDPVADLLGTGPCGQQIYVRDLEAATTTLVSKSADGTPGNGISEGPSISDNGRFVAFTSTANNLSVEPDRNICPIQLEPPSCWDVFLHDLDSGTTELISVNRDGISGDKASNLRRRAQKGQAVSSAGRSYDQTTSIRPS